MLHSRSDPRPDPGVTLEGIERARKSGMQYCACREKARLEDRLYWSLNRHCIAARRLAEIAGTGNHSVFNLTKGECDALRTEIHELESQIGAHRVAHGC